jgi:hypothetical protein
VAKGNKQRQNVDLILILRLLELRLSECYLPLLYLSIFCTSNRCQNLFSRDLYGAARGTCNPQ